MLFWLARQSGSPPVDGAGSLVNSFRGAFFLRRDPPDPPSAQCACSLPNATGISRISAPQAWPWVVITRQRGVSMASASREASAALENTGAFAGSLWSGGKRKSQ